MMRRLTLSLALLLLLSPTAHARSRRASPTRQQQPAMTHKAIFNAVAGLLKANRYDARLRSRLDSTRGHVIKQVADKKTWKPNPKLRVKRFGSFSEYTNYGTSRHRSCQTVFNRNQLALVDVDAGGKKQKILVLDPGAEGLGIYNKLMVTIQGDHLFFTNEYALGTRELKSRAVQVDPKSGKVLRVKPKLDYLLEQYPHEQVVLTRTMSSEERTKWSNPRTHGSSLGSNLMAQMMGTPYKHLCFGTGGYWNDYLQFWQQQVEFKVPKAKIRQWVQQGKAYITPMGADFFTRSHEARVLADRKVSLPFEFTSIDPGLNKQLIRSFQQTGGASDLAGYKAKGAARARNAVPLGAMSLSSFFTFWSKARDKVRTQRKWDQFERLKLAPDGPAKDRQVYKLTEWVVRNADERLRRSAELPRLRNWLQDNRPAGR